MALQTIYLGTDFASGNRYVSRYMLSSLSEHQRLSIRLRPKRMFKLDRQWGKQRQDSERG